MDLTADDIARWPPETRVLMDAAIEHRGARAVKVWSDKALMRSIRRRHADVRRFQVQHEFSERLWMSSYDMAREVHFEDVESFDFKQADVPIAAPAGVDLGPGESITINGATLSAPSAQGRLVIASELAEAGMLSVADVLRVLGA